MAQADRQSKAKQNRAAMQAKARRDNIFKALGVGAIALIVGGVIFIGITGGNTETPQTTSADDLTKGTYPPSVNQETLGWTINPDSPATSELVIWEDFQCPACANFEAMTSAVIDQLVKDDVVKLTYRPTAFLDARFPESDYSSHRAINAFGCAVEAGIGKQFHDYVYMNQPDVEGVGFTNEKLTDFAQATGYQDVAGFGNCVYGNTYMKWGADSTQIFSDEQVPGTPNVSVNGVEAPEDAFASADAFKNWVLAEVAKKK
jgi:protein-disulfide isomerase